MSGRPIIFNQASGPFQTRSGALHSEETKAICNLIPQIVDLGDGCGRFSSSFLNAIGARQTDSLESVSTALVGIPPINWVEGECYSVMPFQDGYQILVDQKTGRPVTTLHIKKTMHASLPTHNLHCGPMDVVLPDAAARVLKDFDAYQARMVIEVLMKMCEMQHEAIYRSVCADSMYAAKYERDMRSDAFYLQKGNGAVVRKRLSGIIGRKTDGKETVVDTLVAATQSVRGHMDIAVDMGAYEKQGGQNLNQFPNSPADPIARDLGLRVAHMPCVPQTPYTMGLHMVLDDVLCDSECPTHLAFVDVPGQRVVRVAVEEIPNIFFNENGLAPHDPPQNVGNYGSILAQDIKKDFLNDSTRFGDLGGIPMRVLNKVARIPATTFDNFEREDLTINDLDAIQNLKQVTSSVAPPVASIVTPNVTQPTSSSIFNLPPGQESAFTQNQINEVLSKINASEAAQNELQALGGSIDFKMNRSGKGVVPNFPLGSNTDTLSGLLAQSNITARHVLLGSRLFKPNTASLTSFSKHMQSAPDSAEGAIRHAQAFVNSALASSKTSGDLHTKSKTRIQAVFDDPEVAASLQPPQQEARTYTYYIPQDQPLKNHETLVLGAKNITDTSIDKNVAQFIKSRAGNNVPDKNDPVVLWASIKLTSRNIQMARALSVPLPFKELIFCNLCVYTYPSFVIKGRGANKTISATRTRPTLYEGADVKNLDKKAHYRADSLVYLSNPVNAVCLPHASAAGYHSGASSRFYQNLDEIARDPTPFSKWACIPIPHNADVPPELCIFGRPYYRDVTPDSNQPPSVNTGARLVCMLKMAVRGVGGSFDMVAAIKPAHYDGGHIESRHFRTGESCMYAHRMESGARKVFRNGTGPIGGYESPHLLNSIEGREPLYPAENLQRRY